MALFLGSTLQFGKRGDGWICPVTPRTTLFPGLAASKVASSSSFDLCLVSVNVTRENDSAINGMEWWKPSKGKDNARRQHVVALQETAWHNSSEGDLCGCEKNKLRARGGPTALLVLSNFGHMNHRDGNDSECPRC